jgi:hypothetical protein
MRKTPFVNRSIIHIIRVHVYLHICKRTEMTLSKNLTTETNEENIRILNPSPQSLLTYAKATLRKSVEGRRAKEPIANPRGREDERMGGQRRRLTLPQTNMQIAAQKNRMPLRNKRRWRAANSGSTRTLITG